MPTPVDILYKPAPTLLNGNGDVDYIIAFNVADPVLYGLTADVTQTYKIDPVSPDWSESFPSFDAAGYYLGPLVASLFIDSLNDMWNTNNGTTGVIYFEYANTIPVDRTAFNYVQTKQPLDATLTSIASLSLTGGEILTAVAPETVGTETLSEVGAEIMSMPSFTALTNTISANASWAIDSIDGLQDELNTLQTQINTKGTSNFSGSYNDLANKPALFNGDYNALSNKPTIPAAQIQSDWNQTNTSLPDFIKNKPALNTPSQSSVTRSIGTTGWRISTTRPANVSYSVSVGTALSLSGGSAGYVSLEIASDSAFSTNLQELARVSNAQTGALTVGLALNQTISGTLAGHVPVGYYARLRSVNTTGTPTYAYICGQEVLV
jgi:hypothetical protein